MVWCKLGECSGVEWSEVVSLDGERACMHAIAHARGEQCGGAGDVSGALAMVFDELMFGSVRVDT